MTSIERQNNRVIISGELTFNTVGKLLHRFKKLLAADPIKELDLQAVKRSDSAGVALLLACLRESRKLNKPLQICNMPQQMLAIAEVCGVADFLPTDTRG